MDIKKISGSMPVDTIQNEQKKQAITTDNNRSVMDIKSSDDFDVNNVENRVDFSISSIQNSVSKKSSVTLKDIKEYNKDHSAEETYNYFKEQLSDLAKNDKENFKKIVDSMLSLGYSHYDLSMPYAPIGSSQAEILEKFLNTQGTVDNAICSTIHGFMMDTLHELGINAAIAGGEEDGGHATLIYQLDNGKYIHNDYGKSTEIAADNITDAMKAVYKTTNFQSYGGYTEFIGKGSDFYEEYAFKDEAAFGDEIDSKNSNKKNAFENSEIEGRSGFNAEYKNDLKNNSTYDVKVDYISEDFQLKAGLAFQSKTNGDTKNFYSSESFGVKADLAKNFDLPNDKGKINVDATVIANSVTGVQNSGTNKFGLFKEKVGIGTETDIIDEKDFRLTNAAKFSEEVSFVKGRNFKGLTDTHLVLEDGIKAEKEISDKLTVKGLIDAGIIADYGTNNYADQKVILNFGGKGNLEGALDYKPTDSTNLNLSFGGFVAKNKNFTNYGGDAEITFTKDFHNPRAVYEDSHIEFGLGYNFEQTNISVGGFNEKIQNEHNLQARASFDLGEKIDIYGTYNLELVKKQHELSVGVQYRFD